MSRRLVLLSASVLLAAPATALAGSPPLPPRAALDAAVVRSPLLRAARAAAEEAAASADVLAAGPHEWHVRIGAQNRNVLGDRSYPEWTTGVEIGLRGFGKRRIDQHAASAEREAADARLAEATRDERMALLEGWFDCLAADRRARSAAAAVEAAASLERLVATRFERGDAARSELDLAQADRAAAAAELATADALAGASERLLGSRGLDAACRGVSVDSPPPSRRAAASIEGAVSVERARRDVVRAALAVDRARADRHPDPMIGLGFSTELGGTERLASFTVTVPIGGARRTGELARARARLAAARAEVEVAVLQTELRQSEFDLLEAAARARHQGGLEEAAARARAAETMSRAYVLGEGELPIVQATRREAARAALAVEMASIEAWRGASLAAALRGAEPPANGAPE